MNVKKEKRYVVTGTVKMMEDREKVIKGLEQCKMDGLAEEVCADCPYHIEQIGVIRCIEALMDDALALLKEQQAEIERLEYELAITQNNLNFYLNGNE